MCGVMILAGVGRVVFAAQSQTPDLKNVIELRTILTTISGSHSASGFLDVATVFQMRAVAPENPNWNPTHPKWAALAILVREDLQRDVSAQFETMMQQNDRQWDKILGTHLTTNDVDGLLAFYHSRVGRRYVDLQTRLADIETGSGAEMLSRMLTGGAGSPVPTEPTPDILKVRQNLLDSSWQRVSARAAVDKVPPEPGQAKSEADTILQMTGHFAALSHGSELDDLSRRYAADRPAFDRFHQSARAHALLAAYKNLAASAASASQRSSELMDALNNSVAAHQPKWKVVYAGEQKLQ
jgi:hypothetical protein